MKLEDRTFTMPQIESAQASLRRRRDEMLANAGLWPSYDEIPVLDLFKEASRLFPEKS